MYNQQSMKFSQLSSMTIDEFQRRVMERLVRPALQLREQQESRLFSLKINHLESRDPSDIGHETRYAPVSILNVDDRASEPENIHVLVHDITCLSTCVVLFVLYRDRIDRFVRHVLHAWGCNT